MDERAMDRAMMMVLVGFALGVVALMAGVPMVAFAPALLGLVGVVKATRVVLRAGR